MSRNQSNEIDQTEMYLMNINQDRSDAKKLNFLRGSQDSRQDHLQKIKDTEQEILQNQSEEYGFKIIYFNIEAQQKTLECLLQFDMYALMNIESFTVIEQSEVNLHIQYGKNYPKLPPSIMFLENIKHQNIDESTNQMKIKQWDQQSSTADLIVSAIIIMKQNCIKLNGKNAYNTVVDKIEVNETQDIELNLKLTSNSNQNHDDMLDQIMKISMNDDEDCFVNQILNMQNSFHNGEQSRNKQSSKFMLTNLESGKHSIKVIPPQELKVSENDDSDQFELTEKEKCHGDLSDNLNFRDSEGISPLKSDRCNEKSDEFENLINHQYLIDDKSTDQLDQIETQINETQT